MRYYACNEAIFALTCVLRQFTTDYRRYEGNSKLRDPFSACRSPRFQSILTLLSMIRVSVTPFTKHLGNNSYCLLQFRKLLFLLFSFRISAFRELLKVIVTNYIEFSMVAKMGQDEQKRSRNSVMEFNFRDSYALWRRELINLFQELVFSKYLSSFIFFPPAVRCEVP